MSSRVDWYILSERWVLRQFRLWRSHVRRLERRIEELSEAYREKVAETRGDLARPIHSYRCLESENLRLRQRLGEVLAENARLLSRCQLFALRELDRKGKR